MESERIQILFDNMADSIFLFYRTELGLSWSLKVGDIYEKISYAKNYYSRVITQNTNNTVSKK